jgi:hypothetical protein
VDFTISVIRKYLTQQRMFKNPRLLTPIEYITFRIICFGARYRLTKHYKKYLKNGIIPNNSESLIIKANFATKGNLRIKLFNSSSVDCSSDFFSKSEILDSVNGLQSQGFANVGVITDEKILSELLKLSALPCYSASDKRNKELLSNPNPQIYHRWQVSQDMVLENLAVQRLLQDNFWKFISESYLQVPTKISSIRCWHSFPHDGSEVRSPENWHLDNGDGINFMKFFILLSDVGEFSGPTSIVPLSAKHLPRKFFTGRRFSDLEVKKLLTTLKVDEIHATGKIGLVYAVDTRLLHRGTPVKTGSRFLMNWTVSSDSFGTLKNEKYKISKENPLYLNGIIASV